MLAKLRAQLSPFLARIQRYYARALLYRRKRIIHRRLAKPMKAKIRRKKRYYELRRRLTEMPRLRSVEGYAAEAQRERPLASLGGANLPGRPTAMRNRDVLQRRYKRTQEFAGRIVGTDTAIYVVLFILGTVGLGGGWYLYEIMFRDPLNIKPGNPLLYAGLAGGGGGIGCALGIYVVRFRRMWKIAYTLVHFVEHAIETEPWRLTAIGRVWLVRLGFAAVDHGRMFSGGARSSGILQGNVIVELPPGVKAADKLRHIRDVYSLPRKRGRFSGESTRALDGRVARVAGLSRRRQNLLARQRYEWLDRIGPWVVIIVCVIATFLIFGGSRT